MSELQPLILDPGEFSVAAGDSWDSIRAKPARDWAPITITRERMAQEIERLADIPPALNGCRQAMFVHPSAPRPGQGLTPGVQVTLDVLKPGEQTLPQRQNATQINFCIQGGGRVVVDDRQIGYRQYDVWNHPSYSIYRHINDTKKLQARLSYSNAALLKMMRVHVVEENPQAEGRRKSPAGGEHNEPSLPTFTIGEDGAALMPYETLINPPAVKSTALHWPWKVVKDNLDKLEKLGQEYAGRRLYLLFNPLTERFNGTTPNFFATITIRPPGIVDKPHRHVSSAINYYFKGSGYSRVEGKRYEWKAGDLMVSAPGWAVHHHASYAGEPVYELTVQDQPLNLYMESLLWQEDLSQPAHVLGTHEGFHINRSGS